MNEKFEWISVYDQLPKWEDDLFVLVYTEGTDFAGEQFFVIPAQDLYDPIDNDSPRDEVAVFATHWTYIPTP